MSGINKQELEEILSKALGSPPDTIPAAMHDTHHKYVQLQIEKSELKKARWEKARQSAMGTIITALFASLIWVGKIVLDYITHNGGNHS